MRTCAIPKGRAPACVEIEIVSIAALCLCRTKMYYNCRTGEWMAALQARARAAVGTRPTSILAKVH